MHTHTHAHALIHTHTLISAGLKRPLPPTTARPSSMSDSTPVPGSAVIAAPKGEEEKKEIHETAPSGAHLFGHEDRYRRPLPRIFYYYEEAKPPAILSFIHSSHSLLSPCALLFTQFLSCQSLPLFLSSTCIPSLSHSFILRFS